MMLIAWHTMMKTVRRSIDPGIVHDIPERARLTPSVPLPERPFEAVRQAHWPAPRPALAAWDNAPRPHGGASFGG